MPDVLGYRAKIGVLVPSTNTIVEPELYAMAPHGVTLHAGRMYVPAPAMGTDAEVQQFLDDQRAALRLALRDVLTLEPDHLIVGITSLAFVGGREGHARFRAELEGAAGVSVTTAPEAADAALRRYGVRRLGLLTPLPPMMDAHFARFFAESDYEVIRVQRVPCATTLAVAQVDEPTLRAALAALEGPDVDAIVQVGADLAMARLADEAERWLGKPVVAINTALLWHALRACGVADFVRGFGALLREH